MFSPWAGLTLGPEKVLGGSHVLFVQRHAFLTETLSHLFA
jgi:hypothetical protein